jgi:hypothetical protein
MSRDRPPLYGELFSSRSGDSLPSYDNRDRPPIYREFSSFSDYERSRRYAGPSFPTRRPNGELNPRNTLRAALESYNTEWGGLPCHPAIPWQDYAHMFNGPPPRPKEHDSRHIIHQKRVAAEEFVKFWGQVEGLIEHFTEQGWPEKWIWGELTSRIDFRRTSVLRRVFQDAWGQTRF